MISCSMAVPVGASHFLRVLQSVLLNEPFKPKRKDLSRRLLLASMRSHRQQVLLEVAKNTRVLSRNSPTMGP